MTKQITITAIVALVISLVVGLSFGGKTTVIRDSTDQSNLDFGSVRQTIDTFVNGVGYTGGVKDTVGGLITLGQNQASWKNSTGKDAYVTAFLKPVATSTSTNGPIASSTMQIIVGTSTAATVGNYTAPSASTAAIVEWLLATSTAANSLNASSTSSLAGPGNRAIQKYLRVKNGEFVNIAILAQANDADSIGAPEPLCVGDTSPVCEAATSTARGYNLRWFLDILTTP